MYTAQPFYHFSAPSLIVVPNARGGNQSATLPSARLRHKSWGGLVPTRLVFSARSVERCRGHQTRRTERYFKRHEFESRGQSSTLAIILNFFCLKYCKCEQGFSTLWVTTTQLVWCLHRHTLGRAAVMVLGVLALQCIFGFSTRVVWHDV